MPRRPSDAPLRNDVRFLGRLLGEVIAQQEGREILELEERIRKLAIARRRGAAGARAAASAELGRVLGALTLQQAEPIIRAFALYFQLVNLAEQIHRARRNRAHEDLSGASPRQGSLPAVLRAAKDAGVPASAARKALSRLEVTLTFTAHPTQAGRRTVLEKLYRVASLLEERERTRLTRREQARNEAALREQVTALWQTDELRHEKPDVGDEVKNVLWYLEQVLWPLLPEVSCRAQEAFAQVYGEPLGRLEAPLRLHSWVGGDMDGNPKVTAEVFADALLAHRVRGLRLLARDVRELGQVLSGSARHLAPPPSLRASIAEDERRLPAVAAQLRQRAEGEPWRRKLGFVLARLEATLARASADRAALALRSPPVGASSGSRFGEAYPSPEDLERDLSVVAESLEEVRGAGAGQVRDVLARVRAQGFHVAELELRTGAEDARDAAAFLSGEGPLTDRAERVLAALRRMAASQRAGGEGSCRTWILSMAHSADDVLAAFRCARAAGLWDRERDCATVDIVPLFETLAALQLSGDSLRELLADEPYARHARARGVQEVMLGYSDSGKEVGLLAASAALRRAQATLPGLGRESGVGVRLFHGRGETVARGGGPAHQAILALPAGSVAGGYKATEQGEALDHKYARPEIALRTLDLVVGGVFLHSVDAQQRPGPLDQQRFEEVYAELADASRKEYRSLVWEEPRFVEFFATASPVDEIAQLNIGSRPAKRKAGGLESLRAIPWVFAWTQNRALLPGWYGVGTALETLGQRPGGSRLLRHLYDAWPFFRTVMDNVEMVLAKTDLGVAARYAALAPMAARKAVWPRLEAEHARAERWIKVATGQRRLLDGHRQLQRSIALRNPYVDPMSWLQVELLRRKRAGEPDCDRLLLLTINGIAAGMRNTG